VSPPRRVHAPKQEQEEEQESDSSASNTSNAEPEPEPEPLTLLATPLSAVIPCAWTAACGAAYDLAHWSELPTASQGTYATLAFATTRDGRGGFLLAGIGLIVVAVALCVGLGFAFWGTPGGAAAVSPAALPALSALAFSPAWVSPGFAQPQAPFQASFQA
jgi:hypothetical protein